MAVKIRLTRIGKKNNPKYRIIVIEEGKKRDGRYVDNIGFYDPMVNPHTLNINQEKFDLWRSRGAQMSAGFQRLFKNIKTPTK